VQIKSILKYPEHPEFEELLNSCGSMTKQLEALGHKLSVTLVYEGIENDRFCRYVTLNLNQKPVVVACSSSKLQNHFFVNLLKKANTVPIGKFLFASGSMVQRIEKMELELVSPDKIKNTLLISLLNTRNYQTKQIFWQRSSTFEYMDETLSLVEIILPELDKFFDKPLTEINLSEKSVITSKITTIYEQF
jgi:chorismate-pyruvate lyase